MSEVESMMSAIVREIDRPTADDADGQFDLGMKYYTGEYPGGGRPPNYVRAYEWFDLAAAHYSTSENEKREAAIKYRDLAATQMTPAEIEQAKRLVREWKPKSAQ
jgi:TPR repeat protein